MAATCLRASRSILQRVQPGGLAGTSSPWSVFVTTETHQTPALVSIFSVVGNRPYSIYGKKSANDIWDSLTNVSPAGQKKGRTKNLMRRVNLNKGQYLGEGKSGLVFPGLSEVPKLDKLEIGERSTPQRLRSQTSAPLERQHQRKRQKVDPLDRGFTSKGLKGTVISSPEDIADYKFTGFETRVIEWKYVANMTSSHGRKKQASVLVVTGNKNGLAGYAVGKALSARAALKKASNKAGQNLLYFNRFEDHTVYHNFREHYHRTQIRVEKQRKGYGLVCHRVIKVLAELIGIKDVYCKVEGRTQNYLSITRAFFNGLAKQETHEELAKRQNLHVVEYRADEGYFPVVIGSPEGPTRTKDSNEMLDFENIYYEGRIPYKKPKPKPFYTSQRSYKWKKFRDYRMRNQPSAKQQRMIAFEDDKNTF